MLRAEALKAVTHGVAAPNRVFRTLQKTRLRRVIERKSVPSPENGAFHRSRICGFAALFLSFLIVASGSGKALDSGQPATPYLRTVFTPEDGLPDNVVNAI